MSGSRPVDWLAAVTTELTVSGYEAGTVASFSMRHPSTRQAFGTQDLGHPGRDPRWVPLAVLGGGLVG